MDGGAELQKALDQLSTRLSRQIQTAALMEGAETIRKRASEMCRRAPGLPDLADNIKAAPVKASAGEKLEGATAVVGIGVPRRFFYDSFLEFGTKHAPAHAFYRPALDKLAQRVIANIGSAIWVELTRRGLVGSSRGSSTGGGLL